MPDMGSTLSKLQPVKRKYVTRTMTFRHIFRTPQQALKELKSIRITGLIASIMGIKL